MELRQVENANNEAEVRRLTDRFSLRDLVERHPRSRGVANIRRLLDEPAAGLSATRSQARARLPRLRRDHGLPVPEVDAEIRLGDRSYFVDFLWPHSRLVAELDSRSFHLTRRAFETDRERERRLAVAGLRVIRVTWRQLHLEPHRLAADLRTLLDQLAA